MERLAPVDDAELGRGAAHVEGEHVAQVEFASQVAGQDRASRRARFHEADRGHDRCVEGGEAAAGGHEEKGADEAAFPQRGGEPLQVAGHEGLNVGVGAGGGEAFVLAHLGADVGGQGDGEAGPFGREDLADAAFVGGVGVGVDEPDRDGFDVVLVEDGEQGVERCLRRGG